MMTILAMHLQPVDDIPGAPPAMLAILRQCLAADPAQRLPSAAALRDELAALLGQPGRAPARTMAPEPTASSQPAPVPGQTGAASPAGYAAQTGPPVHGALDAATTRRWRPLGTAAVAGGGIVLVVLAALIVGHRLFAPGAGPAASGSAGASGASGGIGTFGIATTTAHCAAASVAGAGARCPAVPECWDGLVEINGDITTPSALPCKGPHTWQTFAIAIMPSDVASFNSNVVRASPTVTAVCSYAVLLRSRIGEARLIPRGLWKIQVVPPDEVAYNSGVRTYRCLARLGRDESRTSQFAA
jgi:hypothetical protein